MFFLNTNALQASVKDLCELNFSTIEASVIEDQEIFNLIRSLSGLSKHASEEDILHYFENNIPSFQAYLKLNSKSHKSKIELLKMFFKEKLSKYLDEAWLNAEREKSLELQFKNWGIDLKGARPYAFLSRLSDLNVQNQMKALKLKPLDQFPEDIQALVRDIDLDFKHNTGSEKVDGPILLSSKRLEGMGLLATTQRKYTFNRDFVKSDDQLYFYVQPNVTGNVKPSDASSSRYGNNTLYLDRKLAEKYGWISPYLMDAGDLEAYRQSLKRMGLDVDDLTSTQVLELFKNNLYTSPDFLKS